MADRTFVLLKPDAVQRGLVGEVVRRFEDRGLKIVGMKMLRVPRSLAETYYAEHKGKRFFEPLMTYIGSGPAVAIVLRLASAQGGVFQDGLRGLWTRARFFLLERVRIAGRSRTLFGLEFLTIRRRFRDPRIHFALVCATKSCPPLRDGLYSGPTLDEELEAAATHFMRPGVGYAIDRERGVVTFHRIFRWYRWDFRPIRGPAGALSRWGDPADAAYVRTNSLRIRYAPYDWGLNDARPAPSA